MAAPGSLCLERQGAPGSSRRRRTADGSRAVRLPQAALRALMSVTPTTAGESTSLEGRHLALLIGMNLIWGLNLIASKVGVGQFPPIFFTALRFGALGLLLFPLVRSHP